MGIKYAKKNIEGASIMLPRLSTLLEKTKLLLVWMIVLTKFLQSGNSTRTLGYLKIASKVFTYSKTSLDLFIVN